MTYAQFLLIFVLAPTIALALGLRRHLRRSDALVIAGIALIAFATAYPWDAWAVRSGFWSFEPARVLAWLGPLPVEECAFFVLQTALVGVLASALARRSA